MKINSVYTCIRVTKDYNPVVSVRVPKALLEKMDQAIATGRYRNRPDYIMAALRVMDELESKRDDAIKESIPDNNIRKGRT